LSCSTTDWVFFLLLDIGNKTIESIPVGVRIIDGMFQATAVRAAGFAIVSLSALAPAVKCVAQLFTTLLADFDVEGPVRNHDVYQYL
jgi:Trk-type K+ transport system membrane component